jgi:deazaflavin-dependent oxidoreductase (nitroreductase family)
MRKVSDPRPPKGLGRVLFRLPAVLYDLHLGRLLRHRFLLLDHVGRTSGRRRHVVLEVVERDPAAGAYTVVSGYGDRAAWYRNLRAHPRATITVAGRRVPVVAARLTPDEGGELLVRYARRHPFAIRGLLRFTGYETDGGDADYRLVGRELPFIRFAPTTEQPAVTAPDAPAVR